MAKSKEEIKDTNKKQIANSPISNPDEKKEKIVISDDKKKNEISGKPSLKLFGGSFKRRIEAKPKRKRAAVSVGSFNPPTEKHQTIVEDLNDFYNKDTHDIILFGLKPTSLLESHELSLMLNEAFSDYILVAENCVENELEVIKLLEGSYEELMFVVETENYMKTKRLIESFIKDNDTSISKIEILEYSNETYSDKSSSNLLINSIKNNNVLLSEKLIAPKIVSSLEYLKTKLNIL